MLHVTTSLSLSVRRYRKSSKVNGLLGQSGVPVAETMSELDLVSVTIPSHSVVAVSVLDPTLMRGRSLHTRAWTPLNPFVFRIFYSQYAIFTVYISQSYIIDLNIP